MPHGGEESVTTLYPRRHAGGDIQLLLFASRSASFVSRSLRVDRSRPDLERVRRSRDGLAVRLIHRHGDGVPTGLVASPVGEGDAEVALTVDRQHHTALTEDRAGTGGRRSEAGGTLGELALERDRPGVVDQDVVDRGRRDLWLRRRRGRRTGAAGHLRLRLGLGLALDGRAESSLERTLEAGAERQRLGGTLGRSLGGPLGRARRRDLRLSLTTGRSRSLGLGTGPFVPAPGLGLRRGGDRQLGRSLRSVGEALDDLHAALDDDRVLGLLLALDHDLVVAVRVVVPAVASQVELLPLRVPLPVPDLLARVVLVRRVVRRRLLERDAPRLAVLVIGLGHAGRLDVGERLGVRLGIDVGGAGQRCLVDRGALAGARDDGSVLRLTGLGRCGHEADADERDDDREDQLLDRVLHDSSPIPLRGV